MFKVFFFPFMLFFLKEEKPLIINILRIISARRLKFVFKIFDSDIRKIKETFCEKVMFSLNILWLSVAKQLENKSFL